MRNPPPRGGGFQEIRRRPTLPGGDLQVPSALVGLTAVFGMGTGVTPPPKPPETVRSDPRRDPETTFVAP